MSDKSALITSNSPKPDKQEDKGYVRIKGRLVLMTKTELKILIEDCREKAKENYLGKRFNSDYLSSLRSLLNGVFAAEGSWSGQFRSRASHRFIPKFSIGQNASSDSIELFSLMWAILDFKLEWDISRTTGSNFHIQLRSTNQGYIISILIPYFSLTYGEKYSAGAKLLRLAELAKLDGLSAKFETICLVYGLTPGGRDRLVSLKHKLELSGINIDKENKALYPSVLQKGEDFCPPLGIRGKIKITQSELSAMVDFRNRENRILYPDSSLPMSALFILGFFLGDGCLYIRIRDKKTGLTFIPKFEIKQKNTYSSQQIMDRICQFLLNNGIQAYLQVNDNYVLCIVEGIDNVCHKLLPFIEKYREFFFWKKHQLNMTNQFASLISLDTRNLLSVKYLLIRTIYSIENNRDYSLEYWINRINDIFKNKSVKNLSGEFYISPVKDKRAKTGEIISWNVYLPEFLNVKPRTKYFFFSSYGGKNEALCAAVVWRNSIIDNWLREKGYDINPDIIKDQD
jgi:hypothetical protein